MEKAENREKERLKEETKKVLCCCLWWELCCSCRGNLCEWFICLLLSFGVFLNLMMKYIC